MDSSFLYRLAADSILLLHFAFTAFVVIGFVLILVGLMTGWGWVRNRRFRLAHLVAIGIVVIQAWLGRLCPLTLWESQLRLRAGQDAYTETFVEHWLHRIMFFDAEPWVFTTIYTVFGVLVLLVLWLSRPTRGPNRN